MYFTDTIKRKRLDDYDDESDAAELVARKGPPQSSNTVGDVEMGVAQNGAETQNRNGSKGVGAGNVAGSSSVIGSD